MPSKLPLIAALLCALIGWSLLGSGVYVLAGPGWALVTASAPLMLLSLVLLRGLAHAE